MRKIGLIRKFKKSLSLALAVVVFSTMSTNTYAVEGIWNQDKIEAFAEDGQWENDIVSEFGEVDILSENEPEADTLLDKKDIGEAFTNLNKGIEGIFNEVDKSPEDNALELGDKAGAKAGSSNAYTEEQKEEVLETQATESDSEPEKDVILDGEVNEKESQSIHPEEVGKTVLLNAVASTDIKAVIPIDGTGGIRISNTDSPVNEVLVVGRDNSLRRQEVSTEINYQPRNTDTSAVASVLEEFRNTEYIDVVKSLSPYIRATDKIAIKREMESELGRTVSDEEVNARAYEVYGEKLGWKPSFETVKTEIETLLKGIVERSGNIDASVLRNNRINIFKVLTFLQREYNFEIGGLAVKDLILFQPEVFGANNTAFDRILILKNMNWQRGELQFSIQAYESLVRQITGYNNIFEFIEYTINTFDNGTEPAEWFLNTSRAYIVEQENTQYNTSLYNKMKADERLKSHFIPLLTLSSDSIYAISTINTVSYGLSDTYLPDRAQASIEEFRNKLKFYAKRQESFLDFWNRISETKERLFEGNDIVILDTMQRYGAPTATARELWSAEYGPNALDGVKEFMSPFKYYRQFFFADGEANVDRVSLFLAKLLTDRGQATYTHELTHILEKKVWFNGYGRRDGQGGEVYARGLFEIVDNSLGKSDYNPIFNLNLTYELSDGTRIQNASPDRFMQESDLKEYVSGMMDVIYTLDYAEAMSSLSKSAADKKILFNEMNIIPDSARPNQVKDKFLAITIDKAQGLNTIEDLIDNSIVSGRLAFKGNDTVGEVPPNGYYVIPMFEPIYSALQNNAGSVGDISFRRNAYDLLAEYGYKEGMVAYISNKYPNDEEALNNILADYNGNYKEFKKAMFRRRIDKKSDLKPTSKFNTYEELQALMDSAVNIDLARMKTNSQNGRFILNGVDAVRNLKTEIYREYLLSTNDFRDSIYRQEDIIDEEREVTEIDIPIEIRNESNAQIWEGDIQTINGEIGRKRVTKVYRTVNGVRVGDPVVTEQELRPMRPTIIYRGTKPINDEIVTVEENVPIPVAEENYTDANMYVDESRVEAGEAGLKRVIRRQPTIRGAANGNPIVTEEIIRRMHPKKIYRGTKPINGEIVIVEENIIIPISRENRYDANMYIGETRIEQGRAGLKKVTTIQRTRKGITIGSPVIREEIQRPMQAEIVYIGTRERASAGGSNGVSTGGGSPGVNSGRGSLSGGSSVGSDSGTLGGGGTGTGGSSSSGGRVSSGGGSSSGGRVSSGGSGSSGGRASAGGGGSSGRASTGSLGVKNVANGSLGYHGSWVLKNNIWKWIKSDGVYAKSSWLYIRNQWYHFNANSNLDTGWYLDEANNWYYAIETGDRAGQLVYGWHLDKDGHWYYLEATGKMAIGIRLINGKSYKFSETSSKERPLGSLIE